MSLVINFSYVHVLLQMQTITLPCQSIYSNRSGVALLESIRIAITLHYLSSAILWDDKEPNLGTIFNFLGLPGLGDGFCFISYRHIPLLNTVVYSAGVVLHY